MITSICCTIPKPLWLTSNRQIANRGHRQAIIRKIQTIAAEQVESLAPISGRIAVTWTVLYPKGVRLDKGEASNAQPTTKALLDGLVNAGLIEDDGPKWVTAETFQRGPNLERQGDHEIWVTLTPIEEVP